MSQAIFKSTVDLLTRNYGIYNINPEINIPVSYLPVSLKEALWRHSRPQIKACYRNVIRAIDFLRNGIQHTEQMGYVVGYINISSAPIEHCLLQIGNHYYDPTLEYQGHPVEEIFFIPVRTLSEAYAINLCHKYQHAPTERYSAP